MHAAWCRPDAQDKGTGFPATTATPAELAEKAPPEPEGYDEIWV